MSWLKKIAGFFVGLFSRHTQDAILVGLRMAAPYVGGALELAGLVATVVGGPAGRTASTVMQAAGKLGIDALLKPDATSEELGTAMRDIVVVALRRSFPTASTSDLNRAVEIAVGALTAYPKAK